jgi:hypothetical protein
MGLMLAMLLVGGVQEPRTAAPPLMAALAACQERRVDAERLACFDAAVARLVTAERARDVVVVTREEVVRTRRSLFGLAIDQNQVLPGSSAERIERLQTTVGSAANVGYDRWVLNLAEGGRWRTTEPWTYARPTAGMAVEIRPGAMGSFVLRAPGQRAVKVQRIN